MYTLSLLGGGGNSNSRYDNDDNESNFSKRPPKTTLMDFITSLKISDDSKPTIDNENPKLKDRSETKRRNPEQYYSTTKSNNSLNHATNNFNPYYPSNHYPDQITFQQDGINEQLDSEDDPSHSNYRERRNPLPPRFVFLSREKERTKLILTDRLLIINTKKRKKGLFSERNQAKRFSAKERMI